MSRIRGSSSSSIHLEIPRKSTEIEDPGAHELSSDDEFQDASEERKRLSRPVTPSSPIPVTRVEKVDDTPRHGEVPGTPAYNIRRQDAVPDEVEVVQEGRLSKRSSRQFLETPVTPGGTPIPRTVVEKIDLASPSYGEEPGTPAFRTRMADAIPDIVLKTPDPAKILPRYTSGNHSRNTSNMSIPETVVTRADDELAHGEVPGTLAAEIRQQDAKPDRIEVVRDEPDDSDHDEDNDSNEDEPFGDDFDDFEDGAQAAADDDFGDFDDFEATTPDAEQHVVSHPQPSAAIFPLIDPDVLESLPELLESTKLHLDAMFPTTAHDAQPTSASDEIPADSPVFPTERSRSLWKQLMTPPPLQPPNWTQSRIRRLFLISLGVPVDLDEILPPSKQKKLILPDVDLPSRNSVTNDDSISGKVENDNISKLKSTKHNTSTTSVDSAQSAPTGGVSKRGRERPKSMKPGPPPAPALDLNAVKRICATTDEKMNGFTAEELQAHVDELKLLIEKTSLVLEHWLKNRDSLRKEKEAFEGVIENLVRHAKRVRTFK